jgi:hypothetical protein
VGVDTELDVEAEAELERSMEGSRRVFAGVLWRRCNGLGVDVDEESGLLKEGEVGLDRDGTSTAADADELALPLPFKATVVVAIGPGNGGSRLSGLGDNVPPLPSTTPASISTPEGVTRLTLEAVDDDARETVLVRFLVMDDRALPTLPVLVLLPFAGAEDFLVAHEVGGTDPASRLALVPLGVTVARVPNSSDSLGRALSDLVNLSGGIERTEKDSDGRRERSRVDNRLVSADGASSSSLGRRSEHRKKGRQRFTCRSNPSRLSSRCHRAINVRRGVSSASLGCLVRL